jgi:hypothetical protein
MGLYKDGVVTVAGEGSLEVLFKQIPSSLRRVVLKRQERLAEAVP